MSNYHRNSHRMSEIADWGGPARTFGSNLNEVQSREPDIKVKDLSSKANPEKVVHVNVSKAAPDVQKAIKKTSKKTGKDTYTYDNRRSKRK